MTFQQLTYLVEIAKCGSINKAAQKLFLSQSGISSAVKELEEELGICFFSRSNRGVELTPDGKEFLSYATSLLQQKKRIESLYGESRSGCSAARLNVSTQRYPFSEDAFLHFLQQDKESRFHYAIRETSMDAVIDDVFDHRSDVGVIFLTDLTEKMICKMMDTRKIEFHELAAVSPCVYLRRGHPLSVCSSLAESDLRGYPYVSFAHDLNVAIDFSEEYQMLSFKKPARCISANNRSTVMNILASTNAITTGSGLLIRELADHRVLSIPLRGASPIHLGWICPKYSKLSPPAEQFVGLLEQSVADSIQYTQKEHLQLSRQLGDPFAGD